MSVELLVDKNRKFLLTVVSVLVVVFLGYFLVRSEELIQKENFTIIVLPDTQKYTVSDELNEIFMNQTEWIVKNAEELNIKFVIHEGDVAENSQDRSHYERADKSLSILEEESVPYSVVPGNHDHPSGLYDKFFPASRFSENEWYGWNYAKETNPDDNDNNYQLMRLSGEDYIFLSLDFCPDEDEVKWANETLSRYDDRKAILTTHGYLWENADRWVHVCEDTQYIWDSLIRHHSNLQIVLCGHVHNETIRVDNNLAGKPVYQMLADYQERDKNGNGWLRIMTFVPPEDKIYVKTYSPYLGKFENDENSEFVLDYEMN